MPMDKKSKPKNPPRLSIPISEEQRLRKSRLIPWGMEGTLFRKLLDQVLDLVESDGEMVFALILKDRITATSLLKVGKPKEE